MQHRGKRPKITQVGVGIRGVAAPEAKGPLSALPSHYPHFSIFWESGSHFCKRFTIHLRSNAAVRDVGFIHPTLRHLEVLFTGIIIQITGRHWPISYPMLLYSLRHCFSNSFTSRHLKMVILLWNTLGKLGENWDFGLGCSCCKVTGSGARINSILQLLKTMNVGSWLNIRLKSDLKKNN